LQTIRNYEKMKLEFAKSVRNTKMPTGFISQKQVGIYFNGDSDRLIVSHVCINTNMSLVYG